MSVFWHFVRWRLGLTAADTATTAAERECLAKHASGKHRLAEIGVWEGATTVQLRQAMAADATLYAIDPFPKGRIGFSTQRAIATAEVNRLSNGAVIWVRRLSTDAASDPSVRAGGLFDFVFLDALHTYEGLRDDWTAWAPLVAPGGVIGIHDSRTTPGGHPPDVGSVRFTREVIINDPHFVVAEEVDSLTVMRRRR